MSREVDAVIVQISRLGSGQNGFDEREKRTSPTNSLTTTFLYSREVGLLNCLDLDENHHTGDWVKCLPDWNNALTVDGGPNFQLSSTLIRRKRKKNSLKKCEIVPQINQDQVESCFYNGSGVILDIQEFDDNDGVIKSCIVIWHDYLGLICHFSSKLDPEKDEYAYQLLQAVNFKAVSMSESRHCSFHAVSVTPTDKVRFSNLKFSTAKVDVFEDMMYAQCENRDKVVLLVPGDKSIFRTTDNIGISAGSDINVLYYRIETRLGKIYISFCYFEKDENEFWDAQMENLKKSCRVSNQEDEHFLNAKPLKNENPITAHDFKTYWNQHFRDFWDPEKDQLEWVHHFLIPTDETSSPDTSRTSSICEDSTETIALDSIIASQMKKESAKEKRNEVEENRREKGKPEENIVENAENGAFLTTSSVSVLSSVFKKPTSDAESSESDVVKNTYSYIVEGKSEEVFIASAPGFNCLDHLEETESTISIPSETSEDEENDEHKTIPDDVSDADPFFTPKRVNENGTTIGSETDENILDDKLSDRSEESDVFISKTPKEDYGKKGTKNQEAFMKLENECNHRTNILFPKITELPDTQESAKHRRWSENSSVLNSSTDSNLVTIGRLEDPPLRLSRPAATHNRPPIRREVQEGLPPQQRSTLFQASPFQPQPQTPLLVTQNSVCAPSMGHAAPISMESAHKQPPPLQCSAPVPSKTDSKPKEQVLSSNIQRIESRTQAIRQSNYPKDIPITDQPVGQSVFSRPTSSASSLFSPSSSNTMLKPDKRSLKMSARDANDTIDDYLSKMLDQYGGDMEQVIRLILSYIMKNEDVLRFIKKNYKGLFDCLIQMYKFPEYVCFYDLERLKIPDLELESSGSPLIDRISMEHVVFKYMLQHGDLWAVIRTSIDCADMMVDQYKDRILTT